MRAIIAAILLCAAAGAARAGSLPICPDIGVVWDVEKWSVGGWKIMCRAPNGQFGQINLSGPCEIRTDNNGRIIACGDLDFVRGAAKDAGQ